MSKNKISSAVWLLGLLIVFIGLALLAIDPPRTVSYGWTITIPYTSYKILYPGYHNFTKTYMVGGTGVSKIALPGNNTISVPINLKSNRNCSVTRLRLDFSGEGELEPLENRILNISIFILHDGSKKLLDRLTVPVKPSSIPYTHTPVTTTLRPGETLTLTFVNNHTYIVESMNKSIVARLIREGDIIRLIFDTGGMQVALPLNITALQIDIRSNATGELHLLANIIQKCVITTYLREPLVLPKTSYYHQTIYETHLDLGNLAVSIILIVVGFSMLEISRASSVFYRSKMSPPDENP